MYGLKGNIDATVQVVMHEEGDQRTLTVPFEVKTGKRGSESHIAQTALYTLLLSDRYDLNITYGLLYYLEKSEVNRIQAVRHELIHMVMKRNELACYVRERLSLPPILQNSHLCGRCYARTTCLLYHKLSENGTEDTTAAKDQFKQLVKHLKPSDQSFFQKWDALLTKEEKEMMKFRRELWTMLSEEREKFGRCFSKVIIEPGTAVANEETSKINRYQYTFIKQTVAPKFSFAESQINVGEPIVISDEEGHFALANGYVVSVSKRRIRVAVDRRLHNARVRQPSFDSHTNQDFAAIMEVDAPMPNSTAIELDGASQQTPVLYRLDKDEFSNGMATVRNNLLQIMDSGVFKAKDLRSLIIENRAPRFKPTSSAHIMQTQSWHSQMNSDQKAAVEKVMTAEEYALVLGMPGTGKTTTIAHIIRTLVAKGRTVLLTSYTHTAVDNILLKIKDSGFDILRLGVIAKIHPEVQKFALLAAQQRDSLEQLRDSWHNPPVVATTCLGLNHHLFNQRTFDVCIVDEASQVTLPVCLGPIRMAKSFVLVGDHYQLPPLVQNKEALRGGLDISLFRLLSERRPEAVVSLEHQYRMCEEIMVLANRLIYNGRLKCGNGAVANRSMQPPTVEQALKQHHFSTAATSQIVSPMAAGMPTMACRPRSPECHLNAILAPENKVVFINTDPLTNVAREIVQGNRTTNGLEVTLTTQAVYLLLSAGVLGNDIGVITFYRSQLALLRQSLRGQTGVELHTADKFQGRDKETVIVSFVRSNEAGEVGELLKDWRRVNVAITRARSKLVLIGSKKTLLQGGEVLKGLVKICQERGWVFDLQPGAIDAHYFPEMVGSQHTQPSPVAVKQRQEGIGNGNRNEISSPSKSGKENPLKGTGALRPSQDGQVMGAAPPKRNPLGERDSNAGAAASMKKIKGEFKVPQKVARVSTERVLKNKHVLQDVLNDLI
jgi:DNA replication ATP-dependent helicase Dna2